MKIYSSAVDQLSYRRSLLYDLEVVLVCVVTPTHCIKAFLVHKTTNPFGDSIHYLPPPCGNVYSFCVGEHDNIIPLLVRSVLCNVLMDLFSGVNRIGVDITFVQVLVDALRSHPGCHRIVLGINSDKQLAPVLIKKLLLVLIAPKIFDHSATVVDRDGKDDNLKTRVVVKGAPLGYSGVH